MLRTLTLRRVAPVVLATALSLSFLPRTGAEASACITAEESALAGEINATRARHGLKTLRVDPELSRVAALHSYWMARKGKLYHSRRLDWKITNWSSFAENVGVGGSALATLPEFMASPPHRATILEPSWSYLGVAVNQGGGASWVTTIFESSADPGTRLNLGIC
ncbi:MAG: CAP domain-containing protein [Actinomycetota bacterium]